MGGLYQLACRQQCKEWKLQRTIDGRRTENAVIYEAGYRWCRCCRLFIPPGNQNRNRCACCNNLLRSKSRNIRMKNLPTNKPINYIK